MLVPAIETSPAVGLSSPARMCISVDLPEPDGPMIAVRSPCGMSRETPCSACDGRLALAVDAGQVAARATTAAVARSSRPTLPDRPRGRTPPPRATYSDDQEDALRAARPAVARAARRSRRSRSRAPRSRPAGTTAPSGSISQESSATAGIRKTATWALDASAISAASLMLPRAATTTAPPCSAALPTIATITAATKNSDSPALSRRTRRASRRGSRDQRRHDGRAGEHEQRRSERPARDLARLVGDVHQPVPPQRVPRDADVDDEQDDARGDRQHGERVPLGVAVPAGDRRDQTGAARRRRRARSRGTTTRGRARRGRRRAARSRARAGGSRPRCP